MNTSASIQQLLQWLPDWQQSVSKKSLSTLYKILQCRTPSMGYHLYTCNETNCSQSNMQYHSCRDRHCPGCGASRKEQWIEDRIRELLPYKYYHMVFTIPHELNALMMHTPRVLYDILFEVSAYTLKVFSNDTKYMGAQTGIISILHTWGQQLSYHPHVHSIVSGAGVNSQNQWVLGKKVKYQSLYPIQAMRKVYKGRFIFRLKQLYQAKKINLPSPNDFEKLLKVLYQKQWIVYAKQPFGGPMQVIEYLGRYTHKVAISNHRIKHIDDNNRVTFEYKNYAKGGQKQLMTLDGLEFIRRFSQHILPKRYCKIRSYGLYSNHKRTSRIQELTKALNIPPPPLKTDTPWYIKYMSRYGVNPLLCPCCKKGTLILTTIVKKQTTLIKRE